MACLAIPGMVRVVVVDPEEPRPALGYLAEKLVEELRCGALGRDVHEVDPLLPGPHFVFLIRLRRHRTGIDGTVEVKVAAAHTRVIAAAAQGFGSRHDVRSERRAEPSHAGGDRR